MTEPNRTEDLSHEGGDAGDAHHFTQNLGDVIDASAFELTGDRTIVFISFTHGYVLRFHSTSNPDDLTRFFTMSLSRAGMKAVAMLYALKGDQQQDTVEFWQNLEEAERENFAGAIRETTQQFNEETGKDLIVGVVNLLADLVGVKNETVARMLDEGKTVDVSFDKRGVEALVDFVKKNTFVGEPGQRVGDNVEVIVSLQEARDFVAFAECACEGNGRDCMVCRTTVALFNATGEAAYAPDRPEDTLVDLDDVLTKGDTATSMLAVGKIEAVLATLKPGDSVRLQARACAAALVTQEVVDDWCQRYDLTVESILKEVETQRVEKVLLAKRGFIAPDPSNPVQYHKELPAQAPVVLKDTEVVNVLPVVSETNQQIDAETMVVTSKHLPRPNLTNWQEMSEGERIVANRTFVKALLRKLRPGERLSLNVLACFGAGLRSEEALLDLSIDLRLHADVTRVDAERYAVTFTKAETSEDKVRFEVKGEGDA